MCLATSLALFQCDLVCVKLFSELTARDLLNVDFSSSVCRLASANKDCSIEKDILNVFLAASPRAYTSMLRDSQARFIDSWGAAWELKMALSFCAVTSRYHLSMLSR